MRDASAIIFICTLPLLASVINDAYLTYQDGMTELKMADLGFLWTKYHFESYEEFRKTADPDLWKTVDTILTYKATLVALALPIIVAILTMPLQIMSLFGAGDAAKIKKSKSNKFGRFKKED